MEYRKEIYQYLLDQKVDSSKIGYLYLATAIELGLNNLENLYFIMKLYGAIAEKYNTKAASIGKSISDVLRASGVTGKEFISDAVYRIMYQN